MLQISHPTRTFLFSLVLLVLMPLLGKAQDRATQIDVFVSKYYEARQFNGSVLVAEQGRVIYKKGFGHANAEWDIMNAPDTKFRLGSITKQFTATLIMQLVEEGKLDLEGKITDYLPDYPPAQGNQVTIHHLLTHTSGIPSYTGLPDFMEEQTRDPFEPEEMLAVFSDMDLEFEPGSQFRYNNSGYFILGAIIEAVTGKTYDGVLQERILDPLGLKDTGYEHNEDIIPRRASGYRSTLAGYQHADYLDTSIPYAAGMMYSTVEDLFNWDRALHDEKVFQNAESQTKMFTPFLQSYGYGWVIRDLPLGDSGKTPRVTEHGGGIFGFGTLIRRFVNDEHLIVALDNTEGPHVDEVVNGISRILYGEAPEDPLPSVALALLPIIDEQGIEAGLEHYEMLKKDHPDDYSFAERELNGLGYHYLNQGDIETAIAVFKYNVELFPSASNPYDSLGEAYMEAGNMEQAIAHYKKSVDLNPANQNGRNMLKKLGAEYEDAEIVLPESLLEEYVGNYALGPDFIIAVTREGSQLITQATGQPKFAIYPMSETRFFVKEFEAQLEFNRNEDGQVESITLFQGGGEMPAPRVE